MTDPQQTPEILKHVKHLENQNHKLRRLLISTLDVADQNFASVSMLQEETKSFETTVDNLEKEKNDLETLLTTVLTNDESSINLALLKIEREHLELRAKLDEALKRINKENEEIDNLKTEDVVLKNTITKLEASKQSLQERIKVIEAKESVLSAISSKLKEQLSEIEQKEAFIVQIKLNTNQLSEDHNDDTSKLFVNKIMQENAGSSNSLFKPSFTEEINEKIIPKCSLNVSLADKKIIELEKAKTKLYNDLEETIRNYSKQIDEIRSKLSDPEIKKILHEIDIHKTVLMYNLKLAKLHDETDQASIPTTTSNPNRPADEEPIPDPNVSISDNFVKPEKEITKQSNMENLTKSLELKIADMTRNLDNDIYLQSEEEKENLNYDTSYNTQLELDRIVSKLENERSILLKRLHSVSAVSAQQFEERLLQTQSELHNSFMREVSSDTIIVGNNFDDATNQLYASEEARLEQRIRELEADNERIRKELHNILQEIEMEKSVIQPEMQKLLKQGIEELEHKENDTNDVNQSKIVNK